ncbi:MAG: hypothetical protein JWL86_2163 [Rhizobium sp.]|nr:hypothetical protein [Rhizobium sp.]
MSIFSIKQLTLAFLIAGAPLGPAEAYAQTPEAKTVETALARTLGLDPRTQKVVEVVEQDRQIVISIDRDAFTARTGIPFLARYMPSTLKLAAVNGQGGYTFNTLDGNLRVNAATNIDRQPGVTIVGDLNIFGHLPFGLIGRATMQTQMKDVFYKSTDGNSETSAGKMALSLYRNQRFFSPSTLQVMVSLKDVSDKQSDGEDIQSALSMKSMQYTVLIGATDTNPIVKALWDGEPFMKVVFGDGGAPFAEMLSKARSVESNYSVSGVTHKGAPLDFSLGSFNVKYQSKECGGCRGRFDIGLENPFLRSGPYAVVLGEFLPKHAWISGQVTGIDYQKLVASSDAVINPFSDRFKLTPDLGGFTSFQIPEFKFAAFDETFDIAGSGSLELKYDKAYSLGGTLRVRIKKGRERIETMLARGSSDILAEDFRYGLRKAFQSAKQEDDGTLSIDITIRNNVVSAGGRPVW